MNLNKTNFNLVYQSNQFPMSTVEIDQFGNYRLTYQLMAGQKPLTLELFEYDAQEFSKDFQTACFEDEDIDKFIMNYISE